MTNVTRSQIGVAGGKPWEAGGGDTSGGPPHTECVMKGPWLCNPTLRPDSLGAAPFPRRGLQKPLRGWFQYASTVQGVWNSNSRNSTLLEDPASLYCLETWLWHQAKAAQPHLKCVSHYLRPRCPDSPSHSALTCFQPASSSPSST